MKISEMGGANAPADAPHGLSSEGHATDHEAVFTGDRRRQLDELFSRYPTRMAALLPALWMVQEQRGWISQGAMAEVAELLGLTPAYVKGVVTFYTMYHQHPVGRYFIQVCTTSPCGACGAEEVVAAILRQSGCAQLGTTSPDGQFTVIEVECLGACGFATPIMINEEFVESVKPDMVPSLLGQLR